MKLRPIKGGRGGGGSGSDLHEAAKKDALKRRSSRRSLNVHASMVFLS